MLISARFINKFLKPSAATDDIHFALEQAGVEIEYSRPIPKIDNNVVVGLVTEVLQHPNADRLRIAMVRVSDGSQPIQIVCGAPNIAQGQLVPVALPGAILGDDFKISQTQLRGVESNGMICSEDELEIGADSNGIMVLPETFKIGMPLSSYVPEDVVFDVSVAANRPDLMSAIGLAREVSAFMQSDLHIDFSNVKIDGKSNKTAPKDTLVEEFNVLTTTDIPEITDVNALNEIRAILLVHGISMQSPVVDITNYVLLASGQPMHAYDREALTSSRLAVRLAEQGEHLALLNGKKIELADEDTIITCDDKPVGLAGVMGGASSAVSSKTKDFVFEFGRFDAVSVRRSALRHGMRTDASSRYEKGLTHYFTTLGIQCFRSTMKCIFGGIELVSDLSLYSEKKQASSITVDVGFAEEFIGAEFSPTTIKNRLEKLGFSPKIKGGKLTVTAPGWRPDVENKFDVIEEIVKFIGLENIPERLPSIAPTGANQTATKDFWEFEKAVRQLVALLGVTEVNSYSFISEEQALEEGFAEPNPTLRVVNRRSHEQMYIRRSLLPSLLRIASAHRKQARIVKIYESSKVATGVVDEETGVFSERTVLAVLIDGSEHVVAKKILSEISKLTTGSFELRASVDKRFDGELSFDIFAETKKLGSIGYINTALLESYKLNEMIYLEVDLKLLEKQQKIRKLSADLQGVNYRDITAKTTHTWAELKQVVTQELPENYRLKFVTEYRPKDPSERTITFRIIADSSVKNTLKTVQKKVVQKLDSDKKISIK